MGFKAMLSEREIVDQILHIARLLKGKGEKVSNIIFMGMGEPLLNLNNVLSAINTLTGPHKFGLSSRRITISTSGYAAQIDELTERGFKGRLALSLHAPNQTLRQQLMPGAASAYDIETVLTSVDRFARKTKKRISYEYILIDQLNDRPSHAHELGKLLKNRVGYTHINLIPYNPVPHQTYKRSTKKAIHAFSHILDKYQLSHTIRVTMGDDIKAACGQLATSQSDNHQ
jgi:23S rRNA (adenine2503-C2)-methyltransferase